MEMFVKEFAEMLDVEREIIGENSRLNEIEEWDSIAVIGFISLVKKKYGKILKAADIKSASTIADLFSLTAR